MVFVVLSLSIIVRTNEELVPIAAFSLPPDISFKVKVKVSVSSISVSSVIVTVTVLSSEFPASQVNVWKVKSPKSLAVPSVKCNSTEVPTSGSA